MKKDIREYLDIAKLFEYSEEIANESESLKDWSFKWLFTFILPLMIVVTIVMSLIALYVMFMAMGWWIAFVILIILAFAYIAWMANYYHKYYSE